MCGMCEALGHGECVWCGTPTWDAALPDSPDYAEQNRFFIDGDEVCGYCNEDRSRKGLRDA